MTLKTARLYSFILPVPERFDDNGEPPLMEIPVERKTGATWHAAILGSPQTIQAIRVTIPDVENDTIPPDDFKVFIRLRAYLLDCIRIGYDSNADYFRMGGDQVMSSWNFIPPERGPQFAIIIKQPLNPDYRVNTLGLSFLVSAAPEMRLFVHLIADGASPTLPFQFRFLSYFKIIETHYSPTTNKKFLKFLEPFLPEFAAIDSSISSARDMCAYLNRLRNRCAHIKLSDGDLGFSHIESEHADLYRALRLVGRMAIRSINVNHPDATLRFAESPEQSEEDFKRMEAQGLKPVRVAGPHLTSNRP
jgi:hypothetical protein